MSDETEKVPDYKAPLGKKATPLQERFAGWLQSDAVGYDPATAKSKREAFEEGVRLAVSLRIPFQASDFNREATAAERARREEERAAKAKAEPKAEDAPAPSKPKATKASKAAPAPAPVPTAPPAARKPAARRAPARRAPAATAATPEDAPF